MADFTKAVEKLLGFEGEEYTDLPADKGGPTKWGITLKVLQDFEGADRINKDVQAIGSDKAARIYEKLWWEPYGYKRINDTGIATRILMAAVHCGPHRGHLLAQIAANASTINIDPEAAASLPLIAEDGTLGPETVGRLNEIHHSLWIRSFRGALATHYHRQVEAKKSQRVFLKGWLRRAYH